jgi:hypothetical protein
MLRSAILFIGTLTAISCSDIYKNPHYHNNSDSTSPVAPVTQAIDLKGKWRITDSASFFLSASFEDSNVILDTRGDTILTFVYQITGSSLELSHPSDSGSPYKYSVQSYTGSTFELPALLKERYVHHFKRID